MRLWSLHPSYLDTKGLVALWREGLLAEKVLAGKTRGYKHHPQLNRFKDHPCPQAAIAFYLKEVYQEARRRDFHFDGSKIIPSEIPVGPLEVTLGQLTFEREHLRLKLKKRDSIKLKELLSQKKIKPHPLFNVIPGDVASWEKIKTH